MPSRSTACDWASTTLGCISDVCPLPLPRERHTAPEVSRNLEILRKAYDALNDGDVESALGVLEPDAEWQEHSELPEAGTYHSRAAIRTFLLGYLDSWGEFRQETEELIDSGDRVAVVLRMAARGKGSGIEVEARYAHLWTMRDGRGVRVDAYADPNAAIEALQQQPTQQR
jgi:ketosteroid isomerase-like protein